MRRVLGFCYTEDISQKLLQGCRCQVTSSMLYLIVHSADLTHSSNTLRCLVPGVSVPLLKNWNLFCAEQWGVAFGGQRESLVLCPRTLKES